MILKPVEVIYHVLSRIKNVLYDIQLLKSKKLEVPVISIGNLSFGGTGKTPFIQFLALNFKDKKNIAIVCRSYKAKLKVAQKVDYSVQGAPGLFGDEACLLQKTLPFCHVWSGPQKFLTAEASLVDRPNLILIDDGFSHRQLLRDFDIVLFDTTKLTSEYYREAITSLKRAQAIVLTQTQLVAAEVVQKFKDKISLQFPHLSDSIFQSEMQVSLDLSEASSLFGFCGIAKPEVFLKSLKGLGHTVIQFESFADHQDYSAEFQSQILFKFKSLLVNHPQLKLVTTAKDAVKITDIELTKLLNVTHYQVNMNLNEKARFFEKISSSI